MAGRLLKKTITATAVAAIMAGWLVVAQAGELRLFDLTHGKPVSEARALERLRHARIILAGEHHSNAGHHRAQLQIIRALHRAGLKVAIGLEMFRHDSQADLDRWVAGGIDESRFKTIFLDNWKEWRCLCNYGGRQKADSFGQVLWQSWDGFSWVRRVRPLKQPAIAGKPKPNCS
jgi:uncharacterized iron-regulated protein